MKILFIRITIKINTYETYYFLIQKLFRRKIFTKILEIKISIFICSFQKKKKERKNLFSSTLSITINAYLHEAASPLLILRFKRSLVHRTRGW